MPRKTETPAPEEMKDLPPRKDDQVQGGARTYNPNPFAVTRKLDC